MSRWMWMGIRDRDAAANAGDDELRMIPLWSMILDRKSVV